MIFFLISLLGRLPPDLWKGGEYLWSILLLFWVPSQQVLFRTISANGWMGPETKNSWSAYAVKKGTVPAVPFFLYLWLIAFLAIYNIANFSFFSSSTFIIIAKPSKNKQTVISSVYCLFFSKESWDWLWLRIILQGIKTEFVFFFRNFYMKSNYILHVTRISDLQSQA